MKKRIFAVVLAVALLISLSGAVSAAEDKLEQAQEDILSCILQGYREVDLSRYNLKERQLEQIYDELYFSNQLPWYADYYQYTYEEDTGKILTFLPDVLAEEEYDRTRYEQAVAEVLAETVHPGMSQLQIALSVHDYLVANYTYDTSETYYEGYDLLVRGTAVCNGYVEAYMELLKRAGVECYYVLSEDMDHAWNQVKIGENWYHVDVTWDDPTPNVQGNVEHTFFLLSDGAVATAEDPHYNYNALQKCTDTTYDGEDFWDASFSRIYYESKDVAYIHKYQDETHSICRTDGTEVTALYEFDNKLTVGSVAYTYETVGLGMVAQRLYFCSGDKVYSMATDGTDLREEYTETVSETNCLLGCYATGDTLYLTTWDLEETYTDKEIQFQGASDHTHDYTPRRYEGACDQKGGTEYTCQCGVSYRVEDQNAPGHEYKLLDKQARGLLESGWESWECSRCGDAYTTTEHAFLSKEFLTDEDTMPWLLGGAAVLLWIVIKAGKKKR